MNKNPDTPAMQPGDFFPSLPSPQEEVMSIDQILAVVKASAPMQRVN